MKHLLIFLIGLSLFSCTMQKRKYMSGYHLTWIYKKNNISTQEPVVKSEKKKSNLVSALVSNQKPEDIKTTTEIKNSLNEYPAINKHHKSLLPEPDSCDILIFKDGTEKTVKISEVGADVIKYKRCDMPDGPLYTTNKSELFMAKYRNGVREVFKSNPNTKSVTISASGSRNSNYSGDQQFNVKAILSLIFGIIGLFFGIGVLAILFGSSAIDEIKAEPNKYKGLMMAQVGRTLGIIKLSVLIAILLIFFIAIAMAI